MKLIASALFLLIISAGSQIAKDNNTESIISSYSKQSLRIISVEDVELENSVINSNFNRIAAECIMAEANLRIVKVSLDLQSLKDTLEVESVIDSKSIEEMEDISFKPKPL